VSADNTYKKFAQYYDLYVEGFDKDLRLYKSLCKPDVNNFKETPDEENITKNFLVTAVKKT